MKSFQVSFSLLAPELRTTAATIQIEKRKWKERSLTQRGQIISERAFLFFITWLRSGFLRRPQRFIKIFQSIVGLLTGIWRLNLILWPSQITWGLWILKKTLSTLLWTRCATAALLVEKFPLFDHTDDCARIAMHPKGLMRYTSSTENSRIQKFLCQQTDRSNWNSNTDCHRSSRA